MHYIIPDLQKYIHKFHVLPKYELLNWFDETRLSNNIFSNPNAINYIKSKLKIKTKYELYSLALNINAIKIIKKKLVKLKNKKVRQIMFYLSKNQNAIKILNKYKSQINWTELMRNCNASKLIKSEIEDSIKYNRECKVDINLSKNPGAIKLLKKYPKFINYKYLSENINAYKLINQEIINAKNENRNDELCWDTMCACQNKIIRKYMDDNRINIESLAENKYFVDIVEREMITIENKLMIYYGLSKNINAIKLLDIHTKGINWYLLFKNINAIPLIKLALNDYKLKNKVINNYEFLISNPSIFKINKQFYKNVHAKLFHIL